MSHVCDMQLDIKSLEALEKASSRLGLELVKGKTTYKWYGRSVGEPPEGFTKEDLGKCDHVIRIPNNSKAYEIGVVKRKDGKGYQLLWDFWNGGFGLEKKVGKNGGLLKQGYAAEVARKQMLREGYKVKETVNANGELILTFTE